MAISNHPSEQRGALISHSSILIFSGFLIGLASGHSLPGESERLVFFAGLVGLIAYLGLGVAARHQRKLANERASRAARSRLEQRLDRHNPRELWKVSDRPSTRLSEEEEQYLTVVSTSRVGALRSR